MFNVKFMRNEICFCILYSTTKEAALKVLTALLSGIFESFGLPINDHFYAFSLLCMFLSNYFQFCLFWPLFLFYNTVDSLQLTVCKVCP